jgi:hypothetical protein
MATVTNITATSVQRNGGVAIGPRLTIVERLINFATTNVDNGDDAQLFSFVSATCVICAWIEVETASTGSGTASLGKATGAECLAASALNGTAGTFYMSDEEKTFVMFTAADTLDLAIGTANATDGSITVRALCLDVHSLKD